MRKWNHDDHDPDFIHPLDLASAMSPPSGDSRGELLTRRQSLKVIGSFGMAGLLAACSSNFSTLTSGSSTEVGTSNPLTGGSPAPVGTCSEIPGETKGPYPLEGSVGGTNALSALYRSNIIGSDIASLNGVPLVVNLNLQNISGSCAAIAGAAVYIWHCDQQGSYSGYSNSLNGPHSGKTFCRGIVITDSQGQASFTTLFPGWYPGRITHIHLAVYLNNNLTASPKVSQFAFPQPVTQAVYATSPYAAHGQNTTVANVSEDAEFRDGSSSQIASVSGTVGTALVANLKIGIRG